MLFPKVAKFWLRLLPLANHTFCRVKMAKSPGGETLSDLFSKINHRILKNVLGWSSLIVVFVLGVVAYLGKFSKLL